MGRNLLAAGGQGVQHGHVQVAEHRHGDGARNGRRGHDQPVRQGAVGAAQAVALLHAEAVLLVHDDQAQVVEAHVVGEQGVRTNHNLRGAVGKLLQHLALGAGAHGGGQQAHAHSPFGDSSGRAVRVFGRGHVPQDVQHRTQVLLGEHLGRGEHRGLAARIGHLQHGAQCHHGFAGTHVTL